MKATKQVALEDTLHALRRAARVAQDSGQVLLAARISSIVQEIISTLKQIEASKIYE